MAMARETDHTKVKPLQGAIVRRFIAGSAIEAAMPVAMASDGYVDPADGSDATLSFALGIAVNDAPVAGDPVDVVLFGPVICVTGATPGTNAFVSDTAGDISAAVGTKDTLLGTFIAADTLHVNVRIIDLA
jgi:hypothetical protein